MSPDARLTSRRRRSEIDGLCRDIRHALQASPALQCMERRASRRLGALAGARRKPERTFLGSRLQPKLPNTPPKGNPKGKSASHGGLRALSGRAVPLGIMPRRPPPAAPRSYRRTLAAVAAGAATTYAAVRAWRTWVETIDEESGAACVASPGSCALVPLASSVRLAEQRLRVPVVSFSKPSTACTELLFLRAPAATLRSQRTILGAP